MALLKDIGGGSVSNKPAAVSAGKAGDGKTGVPGRAGKIAAFLLSTLGDGFVSAGVQRLGGWAAKLVVEVWRIALPVRKENQMNSLVYIVGPVVGLLSSSFGRR